MRFNGGLVWVLVGASFALVMLTVLWAMAGRYMAIRKTDFAGALWKRAYDLGSRLADGAGYETGVDDLAALVKSVSDPAPIATALAAVSNSWGDTAHDSFFEAIQKSNLDRWVQAKLASTDHLEQTSGLEYVEALRLESLLGQAANFTRHDDEQVKRAACEAMVAIDPTAAIGVLVGMVRESGSWVLDTLGRATNTLIEKTDGRVPVARPQWRGAPMLAEQALKDGGIPDPGAASDALAVLIDLLDDESSQKRLAAVNALANTINHPGAQIALAGALSAPDRLTRFAAASRLAQTDAGRSILHRSVNEDSASDAAVIAAEVLWTGAGRPDADADAPKKQLAEIGTEPLRRRDLLREGTKT